MGEDVQGLLLEVGIIDSSITLMCLLKNAQTGHTFFQFLHGSSL
jgi:hypothetical protein